MLKKSARDTWTAITSRRTGSGRRVQEGVEHHDGAAKGREAGLDVVMDRCILKEHRKYLR